jgi:hypothetical protein
MFSGDIIVHHNYMGTISSYTNLGQSYTNDTGLDGKTFFTGSEYFSAKEIEIFEISDSTVVSVKLHHKSEPYANGNSHEDINVDLPSWDLFEMAIRLTRSGVSEEEIRSEGSNGTPYSRCVLSK